MIEVAIIKQASPRCLADPCSLVFATTAGRVFGGMDSGARPRARRLRCFLWVAVVVGLVLPWTGLLHPTHTDAVAHWRGRRGSRIHGRSWRNLVLRKACSLARGGCAAVRASSPPGFLGWDARRFLVCQSLAGQVIKLAVVALLCTRGRVRGARSAACGYGLQASARDTGGRGRGLGLCKGGISARSVCSGGQPRGRGSSSRPWALPSPLAAPAGLAIQV